ncbi:putative bifunctional diguanylate cyclase/phosphodiesterase [Deinococcus maricopensis]|uniref:Diguanylate cyclase/phosphodiesterase n=1 Tax=Deinococcus maricopensis (strain DSM 21211 / LMG 22137 / NRRL B-23946 / LB-34) TaxID=709986 RepID=E8U332_DEIML|nr:EAL domain-containing protein [Deinococcus maricopensis]ADV65770.1 diguanylate cyclase/phosphodiesterase [Deinococcus maricopensis DSM 21211]
MTTVPPTAVLTGVPLDVRHRIDTLNDEADAILMTSMQRARALAAEAYALAERAPYPEGATRALMLTGYSAYFLGHFDEARAAFERAAADAQALTLPGLTARSLSGLAITVARAGQYGEALEHHLACLRLVQSTGDELGQARSLNNIGNLHIELREHDQALQYHLEALEIARRIAHPLLLSSASINAAMDYHQLGRYEEALHLNEVTLQRALDAGYRQHEGLLHGNIAANLLELGRPEDALRAAQVAVALTEELGDRENGCDAQVVCGRALQRLGRLDEAQTYLKGALTLAEDLQVAQRQSEAHQHLADLLEAQGEHARALAHFRAHEQLHRQLIADVLRHKSQVLATQLQVERLSHRAAEEQLRNQELAQANAALQCAQAQLEHQTRHDALTGLLNRAAFEGTLHAAMQSGAPLGVLFIDLDRFKQVNDTLGHPAGDALLMLVADRLRQGVRDGDVVARQGGDEFIVLLRHVQDHADVELVAQRLLDALSLPVTLEGRTLVVTASIGMALFPHDGADVTTLHKHADLAMYSAKRDRRSVRRFQAALSDAAQERLNIEQDLRAALERDELQLHYQPVVPADGRGPCTVEALVRWQHPTLGLLLPARFLPIAEESDLMVGVGEWVLRAACAQLRAWRARWPDLRVSVNVAAQQLDAPDFAGRLTRLLAAHTLDADALELELPARVALDPAALPQYAALAGAGVRFAIDDFGTGYSSMSRLFQVPAQVLKIDRAVIADLLPVSAGRRSSTPLVRALITFAQEAGMQVVAEGVEQPAQARLLRAWNCDRLQGYAIARPMPSDALDAWLARPQRHGGEAPA